MTEDAVLVDPLDALLQGPDRHALRVGLAVPTSGALGLTGPSALACAVLAAEEVNAAGGVRGRRLELVLVDAGRGPREVAEELGRLVGAGVLDAVCGYHTSDVHRRLEAVTAGRLPYVFTPPHEGGTRAEGVVLLGEGPREQLLPVMTGLAARPSLRRWALVGNDYIWPWAVHTTAARMLRSLGAEVVLHELVPFGGVRPERLIERVRRSRAQAVLLSLVGRDLVIFNRAFHHAGLDRAVLRVSGALEENGLLEAGGDDSGELYAAMRWFASDEDGDGFSARYEQRWGPTAPSLGAYAQGCYEGVRHVAELGRAESLTARAVSNRRAAPAARVRLARADGLALTVVP
ncbi:ABC transporter substrate-binding protein [Solihabitans fulvus]|uniref:ABC transporter substrate-binding protein n=1 Tax=Solihabitans fulvus TaxID=1892852 RepID=A0A5B2X414_9PSEU|nr:substrate-binding domain-containing protein [Solihabitans fulvus]KAA2258047.1 ABC transporter substrate-binding protein [Solihabitans fulvus]